MPQHVNGGITFARAVKYGPATSTAKIGGLLTIANASGNEHERKNNGGGNAEDCARYANRSRAISTAVANMPIIAPNVNVNATTPETGGLITNWQ